MQLHGVGLPLRAIGQDVLQAVPRCHNFSQEGLVSVEGPERSLEVYQGDQVTSTKSLKPDRVCLSSYLPVCPISGPSSRQVPGWLQVPPFGQWYRSGPGRPDQILRFGGIRPSRSPGPTTFETEVAGALGIYNNFRLLPRPEEVLQSM